MEPIFIFDEIAKATKETLERYKEFVAANRFEDARQCLTLVRNLTDQAHNIEDHPDSPPTWSVVDHAKTQPSKPGVSVREEL